uniref:TRAF3-interacting protein 1 n=1 Tax=Albugo laibachii Nc14 TaxID=890382 RepID=F0WAY1_9STRA|nr:TRAF3interacting protein putative [Albugo laibachii Nc14]CCA18424.1 TRAF3interacting protein putative [Albugo laibachii Nc14]|eukprot:CCA18424.1 TRAF3interacting protein putative [Albugo laibachii Nc14]
MEQLETLIANTQELLQPVIAKPKLTEKLLAKPPFRFLHDIFTAVIQTTEFAKGLYSDFDLDSANIKEKNQKLTFLDKMLLCVSISLNKEIEAKSIKIVAGLEAECTNTFLQDLARAATNKSIDHAAAVAHVLQKIPSVVPDGEQKHSPESVSQPPAGTKHNEKRKDEDAVRKKEMAHGENVPDAKDTPAESKLSSTRQRVSSKASPSNDPTSSPEIVQAVKDCNGDFEISKSMIESIISKPKMSVKLLSKPPFRFLHDVISEITRATGFADGLYSAEELDSGNIKEKQPKIDYLNKIIQCVSYHLRVDIAAKSAKIVAGLEPEETNQMLQLLTIACKNGDSKASVQQVLSGDHNNQSTSSRGVVSSKGGESRQLSAEAKASRSTPPSETKSREKKYDPEQKRVGSVKTDIGRCNASTIPMVVKGGDKDTHEAEDVVLETPNNESFGMGTSGGSETSRDFRPTTARRRPPKLKENVTEVGRLTVHDIKVAPVVGIMKEGDNAESDEDTVNIDNNDNDTSSFALAAGDTGIHGKLVQDILRDQAEEVAARQQKQQEDPNNKSESQEAEQGIRFKNRAKSYKQKSKAASNVSEMTELRHDIQKICQATNPLGKCMESVHEDLDSMSKELEKWKKEYEINRVKYEDERKKTNQVLQPLQNQLVEIGEQIQEQMNKIHMLKAVIVKNEESTLRLLRMVVGA